MRKERLMEFDIEALIYYARKSPKFYKEFVLSFNNNKEAIETAIKLAINIEDDKYYNCVNCCNIFKIIRDVSIFYGIYENEEQFCKDSHISFS